MKYKIKKLMQIDVSKIYIMGVIIFCLILLGSYFSYAMFTVNKEKNRAISIVTGTLEYELKVNDNKTNIITVPGNSNATYTINLNNINSRDARLNFYYIGDLPSGVDAGYIVEEGTDIPPIEKGEILSKAGSNGDKKVYKIKVFNSTSSSININLGVQIGLDYNDLNLPSDGHLFTEYVVKASDTIIENVGNNGGTYDDGIDTFITGTNPNNYIWYSGKLWRAVSINNEAKTIKLVTQWDISTNNRSDGSSKGAEMDMWLNDTTVDGFLGNLREPEKFIVTNAKWDTTLNSAILGSVKRPNGTNTYTNAVGLLNLYEYQESYRGTDYSNGYLNTDNYWWTLTSSSDNTSGYYIDGNGYSYTGYYGSSSYGVRPSIVLKSDVKIASGSGTESDPYRLSGDNDTELNGVKLNTRYSGEYIKFGDGENNLYRIVSHENGIGTKITSADLLKKSKSYVTQSFDSSIKYNISYSSNTVIGKFLNGEYLTDYVGNDYIDMIEDETTWYLGKIKSGSYKLAKYTNESGTTLTSSVTTAKVGLLRHGELMAGHFGEYNADRNYWILTPYDEYDMRYIGNFNGDPSYKDYPINGKGIKPALNLKENVVITSGDGTKNNPFELSLS